MSQNVVSYSTNFNQPRAESLKKSSEDEECNVDLDEADELLSDKTGLQSH